MAGDTPITKRVGLPRNLFMAPPNYGTAPAQPAMAQQPMGQGFGAPPPPALGGPPQMGGAPMSGGMTQMGGQMAPPVGQPPQNMGMGGGGPMGAPPQWQQAAQMPPPSSSQQAFEGAVGQQGGDGAQQDDDPLDDFVNFHAQQAQMTGQPSPHLGFFDTLKQARDRDPEGFYMLLGAVATGDPDRVMQVAGQFRHERLGREAATQQELMGVARERSQRQETQRYRTEDRGERQQFAKDQRQQSTIDRLLDSWEKDGALERIETELGHPISSMQDVDQARRIHSKIKDDASLLKEKDAFARKHAQGVVVPAAGRIKMAMDSDPEFANAIGEIDRQRKEWDTLKKDNIRERTLHTKRVTAAVARVDPAMRLLINDLQRQLTAAEKDEDNATNKLQENRLMATIDKDGSLGYAQTQDELSGQYNDAVDKATAIRESLDDALANIGAVNAPRPRRMDDADYDDDAPPPTKAPPKKRDFSKLDSLLGGP